MVLHWAKREVEEAIKREREDKPESEWDYGVACYESALKAYEALISDNHSGFSITVTKNILNRLIDGNPLTPIEDTEDIWNLVSQKDGLTIYQCSRMSSLFKNVTESDGNVSVKYNNLNACYCIEEGNSIPHHSSLVNKLYSEIFPITLPYMPPNKPDIVVYKESLTDPENGDFDTIAILRVQKPSGKEIEVNRYFKEAKTDWEEIGKAEYDERVHKQEDL